MHCNIINAYCLVDRGSAGVECGYWWLQAFSEGAGEEEVKGMPSTSRKWWVQRCLWIIAMTILKVIIRDGHQRENNAWYLLQTTSLLCPQEASCFQALFLLEDFSHANFCWKSSTESFRHFWTPLYGLSSVGCITRPAGHPHWANHGHLDWRQPELQWSYTRGVHSPEEIWIRWWIKSSE